MADTRRTEYMQMQLGWGVQLPVLVQEVAHTPTGPSGDWLCVSRLLETALVTAACPRGANSCYFALRSDELRAATKSAHAVEGLPAVSAL